MRGHISEDRMIDLLEDQGTPADWAHVASCAPCRSRLEEGRAAMGLATQAEVPEPPGLYWEALRRNVSRRIAEEGETPRRRWGWLAPLAATAVALLVVAVFVAERPGSTVAPPAVPAWSALPPVEEDENLTVLAEFAIDAGEWSGWEEGQGLGAFVASLSDEESEALVAALRVERPEGEL